ncbi:hypothetical protein [Bradyrhizobium sp. AS23.2]|uniref:hypothetical protein n=1 Tax=Bradyrhizobium sp. AS23.2 TaxID=1680155 RepID=UPI001160EFFC|nr:hypothetical protein [Bradyrhizobium sp. AS23.2]
MYRFTVCLIFLMASAPALAQNYWRSQGGFDSRQPNGPVDLRVDGRANKREGLPPSAADKSNGTHQNPIYESDCAEVDQLNPNARQRYQSRVRRACGDE